jgi:hypothetical protein
VVAYFLAEDFRRDLVTLVNRPTSGSDDDDEETVFA